MVAKKAASFITQKLETLITNTKWYKEPTWISLGFCLSMIFYGTDLERSTSFAKEVSSCDGCNVSDRRLCS